MTTHTPITWDDAKKMKLAEVQAIQREHIARACSVLLTGVHEVRAINATTRDSGRFKHTVSGYFDMDHHAELVESALRMNAPAIYFTINPGDPDMIGRAFNRARSMGKGDKTTGDPNITRLRTLFIDVDPVRPPGTSATPDQHRASHMLARGIRGALGVMGWPAPLYADSGNGAHLLYRIDLDATEWTLVKRVLGALGARFDQTGVKVDQTVHNPSRICKLYGTWAKKGDHHPGQPHRLSQIIDAPDDLVEVSREQLEELAPESTVDVPERKRPARRSLPATGIDVDVERWAADVGLSLPPAQEFPSDSGMGKKWRLKECPCARREDGSAIMKAGNGTVSFKCHHNNCGVGKDWQALREALEPARLPRPAKKKKEAPAAKVVDIKTKRTSTDGGKTWDRPAPDAPAAATQLAGELGWLDHILRNNKGFARNNVHNILLILANDDRWRGVISMDEMSARVIKLASAPWSEHERGGSEELGPWTDGDTTALQGWFAREYRFEPGVDRTHACVVRAAEAAGSHPVRAYLEGLVWDGVDRLDHWLDEYCHAERTPYTIRVGKWWLISAVARVFEPGCQADYVLVLEGDQGFRKSTALRTLCHDEAWFCDSKLDMGSKDAMQLIRSKWIVELAELAGLSRKEAGDVKAFITSKTDSYRPSYGRMTMDVPRQMVFSGTVNPGGNGYLSDPTGARRWWPVTVPRRCDVGLLGKARDQLWAEAAHRYHAGERYHPETEEDQALCKAEQDKRMVGDSWTSKVAAWLLLNRGRFVTSGEILAAAIGVPHGQQDRPKVNRVCSIMRQAEGWTPKRKKEHGQYVRGWQGKPLSAMEQAEEDACPF